MTQLTEVKDRVIHVHQYYNTYQMPVPGQQGYVQPPMQGCQSATLAANSQLNAQPAVTNPTQQNKEPTLFNSDAPQWRPPTTTNNES